METFDLAAVPELDIRLLRDLAGSGYIREQRNVNFLGRSGAGKTHMATALGIEACKNNFRTRFASCYGLVIILYICSLFYLCDIIISIIHVYFQFFIRVIGFENINPLVLFIDFILGKQ